MLANAALALVALIPAALASKHSGHALSLAADGTTALNATLPEIATYTISPALAPGLCIAPSNSTDGASLVLANCSDADTVWRYNTKNGKVRNMNDGFCVDVRDGVFENGTDAQMWSCASCNSNQNFNVTALDTPGTGNYSIQWAASDFCLDLIGGNTTVGAPVQVWKCLSYNDNQKWTLDAVIEVPEDQDDGALDTYNAALLVAQNTARQAAVSHSKRHIYRRSHH